MDYDIYTRTEGESLDLISLLFLPQIFINKIVGEKKYHGYNMKKKRQSFSLLLIESLNINDQKNK